MKNYQLNYCEKFKCIADKCNHTCCAGWEMNIDQKTLGDYKNNTSKFSHEIKKGVNFRKSKFKVDKNKRCAFLNEKNLCDIITNLGEQSLCQVCSDHPRFRSFFSDRIELGLGFCCEEATHIILNHTDKIQPILVSDDGSEQQLSFNENNVLQFRKKVLDIIQDRSKDIDDRINELLTECRFDETKKGFSKFIKLFLSLEKIDKNWIKKLKSIKTNSPKIQTEESYSLIAEQFLTNGIYRHLSDAEDTIWVRARLISIILFWWLVLGITTNTQTDIYDVVREFSTEIEYSQKNLNKVYKFAYELISI